ncbi:hypothetical protein A3I58_01095 [Candidatus Peregrinibacteria bacterium RIFCSPLOWO2_02_FULL_39_10]|nr:MAG: hypothetical protein A3I58_01095 [Candidatus Peregrinibacteria bacterium RIFCSPLOWO2_02_FULL_39_10]
MRKGVIGFWLGVIIQTPFLALFQTLFKNHSRKTGAFLGHEKVKQKLNKFLKSANLFICIDFF